MRRISRIVALEALCALLLPQGGWAQSGPEEQAIVAMALAKDVRTLEQHLPEAVREQIARLPPASRAAIERALWEPFRRPRLTARVPEDGHALLTFEEPGRSGDTERVDIVVARKISSGAEALVELQPRFANQVTSTRDNLQVWLKFEGGEWRLSELRGPWGDGVRFDEHFVERYRSDSLTAYESSAVGGVRTLNTAQVTYSSTYPEEGFAASLQALAGDDKYINDPSPEHAVLIDTTLGSGTSGGYHYTLTADASVPHSSYQIVARPVKYGETGRRSFYSDESGVIRSTEEDREATAQDPPLQ